MIVIKVAAKILCTLIQEWKCLPIHGNPTVYQAFLPCCEEVFSISSGFVVRKHDWIMTSIQQHLCWVSLKENVYPSLCLTLYYNTHCRRVCVCRCQTAPCEECEYHGQSHTVGDRWWSDQCQLCRCLPNLTVQCSPYCPYAATGCPQVRGCVWLLFILVGKSY